MSDTVSGQLADVGRTCPSNNINAKFEFCDANDRLLAKEIDFIKAHLFPKASKPSKKKGDE